MVVGRAWVLDAVEDWLFRGDERFLLLVAEPGWGKTAVARWLAGDDPAPSRAGPLRARVDAVRSRIDATHFCVGRGQDGAANPAQFATGLAQQLMSDDGVALALLAELSPETRIVQNVGRNAGQVIALQNLVVNQVDPRDVYHRVVRRPLQRLAGGGAPVIRTILVDALDEAPAIVGLLAGSGDFPSGVRFVLTTRDVPAVVDAFDDARLVNLSGAQFAARTDEDLRDYIAGRVGDRDRVDDLVRQADGNFLYAYWLLAELARGTDIGALPRGLNGLYRAFLDRLVPSGDAWLTRHEPFLGCLTVATPVAPDAALPRWLDWSRAQLNVHLDEVTQAVEHVPDPSEGDPGYRLYHRSVADFLVTEEYEDGGRRRRNRYYVEPLRQHERIVEHYLRAPDWERADEYCLRRLVHHLAARARLGGPADDLYRIVLDERFRFAQQDRLGIHRSLTDLREALDVALARGDLLPALRCVAGYRSVTAAESLSAAVFEAVDVGDFGRAVRKMSHYTTGPNASACWNEVLKLYLAWEAAESGAGARARELVGQAAPSYRDLGGAFLARIAAALGVSVRELGGDPRTSELYEVAPECSPDELQAAVLDLEPKIERLERHIDAKSEPVTSALMATLRPHTDLLSPESSSMLAYSLGEGLGRTAAHPIGRALIERTLAAVSRNPYPRYRDLALRQIGTAVLRSPDRLWARARLRRILRAGLDDEGVTFTFDLPVLLVAEGERRGLHFEELRAYVGQAAAQDDIWGTEMRFNGARAAAASRLGDPDRAYHLLLDGSRAATAYAGYGTLAVLSLIDRCHEIGRPRLAGRPIWGPRGDQTMPDMAEQFARTVQDPEFGQERLVLVADHRLWRDEPPPDPETALARHSRMGALDTRAAYRGLISARWSGAGGATARQVARLVPLALADTTGLDALLARLVGAGLERRGDDEVRALAELTTQAFTTGRPWSSGQWR
ncbi:hypothetical protein ACQP2F_21130 [Actinoplanes sp. CA-030573]|uniref:hypothetical protein n=1 Tax=Actinoplanes sp. CA-030573 TaxID=3239898 RepID=UPI003D8F9618